MLLDLINEVLDISRIEAGKLSLSLEPVQISGIINEMMDVVYPLAKSRKISIEFEDSPTNALFVKSDKQRLKQVVLNLLTNAIKYNQVGGKITISSEPVPGDLVSKIRISITDTGLGIPSGSIDKIFNPFERLGAEKSETEGSGLGLSVVKKLLEAMNGAIGVESIPGDGSTFWFELPKCFSQRDTINLETLNSEDLKKHHKKGTILYIEDNISNIELFEQILFAQRSGIRLISSMNGKSALALAKGNSPDLIFLDLNLPDVHGSEILAQLAADKETSRIPVVILSADVLSGQVDRLLKAGARECLSKPLDILKLLNIIDEYIVD
jgi:CheY-like chemotaxis protein/two-component sensor histidine kinase